MNDYDRCIPTIIDATRQHARLAILACAVVRNQSVIGAAGELYLYRDEIILRLFRLVFSTLGAVIVLLSHRTKLEACALHIKATLIDCLAPMEASKGIDNYELIHSRRQWRTPLRGVISTASNAKTREDQAISQLLPSTLSLVS
jgi:CheY-like chemotaxis protein